MLNFRDVFTIEQFTRLVEVLEDEHRSNNLVHQVIDTEVAPAISALLADKAEKQQIKPITTLPNADIPFVRRWNAACEGKPDKYTHPILCSAIAWELVYARAYVVVRPRYSLVPVLQPSGTKFEDLSREYRIQYCYDLVIDAANAGMVGQEWKTIECSDHKTGQRLSITIRNWVPEIAYFDNDLQTKLPYQNPLPMMISTVDLDFPTGELLAFDWLRIDSFTENANLNQTLEFDIGAFDGREKYTRAHAEKLNMVHVTAGNCGPGVYVNPEDQSIIIADEWDHEGEDIKDTGKYEKVGSICCDLWWASIIDKATAIKIASGEKPNKQAIEALNKYIDDSWSTPIFKVIPGRYRLHFSGDQEFFDQNFDKVARGINPAMNLYCFLEPLTNT